MQLGVLLRVRCYQAILLFAMHTLCGKAMPCLSLLFVRDPACAYTLPPHGHARMHACVWLQIPPRPQHPFHQYASEQALDAALRNSTALPEIVQEIMAGEGNSTALPEIVQEIMAN